MIILCPNCKKEIKLPQDYFYHAGFSDEGFLYCNKCSSTLEIHNYNKRYIELIKNKCVLGLNKKEKEKVEDNLKPCECGGKFKFDIPPRCPYCKASLQSLLPDDIHFMQLGNVHYSEKNDIWKKS